MLVSSKANASKNSSTHTRHVLRTWTAPQRSTTIINLLNQSNHFQFDPIAQEESADLVIVDCREERHEHATEHPVKSARSQISHAAPTLIITDDTTDLIDTFEFEQISNFFDWDFVHESEVGSRFLDARIVKLLKSTEQHLREKQNKDNTQLILNTVMKHSNDWMVIKNLENQFLYATRKFCDAHKLPVEGVIGKNDLEIGTSPELVLGKPGTDWKGFWNRDKEVIESKEHVVLHPIILEEDNYQERIETTDKIPLQDEDGNVFALFICVAEKWHENLLPEADESYSNLVGSRVWELKKNLKRVPALTTLDNERKRMEALIDENDLAFTAKNQFIASASHDLRQPLHAIGFYLKALEGKVDGDGAYLVHSLGQCVDSLNELLNSLLDISRLDANVVSTELSSFSAYELLRSLCDECKSIADEKSLELTCKTDGSRLHSDPILLRRVIRNLLMNSLNYTDKGKVSITGQLLGSHVNIVIADTGIGIPEEKQQRVFDEFEKLETYTPSSPHFQQGLGLGLSIVKRLCKLLDIKIELKSTVGKGTRVSVRVPLGQSLLADEEQHESIVEGGYKAEPTEELHPIEPAKMSSESPEVSLKSSNAVSTDCKLVLIVDDEPRVCDAVETILLQYGYRAISSQSPEQALELLQESSLIPDVILADFRLSETVTGLDAIKLINQTLGVSTPALLVTGDTTEEGLREITRSGYLHLHKPVKVDQLLDIVHRTVHPK